MVRRPRPLDEATASGAAPGPSSLTVRRNMPDPVRWLAHASTLDLRDMTNPLVSNNDTRYDLS